MCCQCRKREPGTCASLGREGATGRSLRGCRPTVKRRLPDRYGALAKDLGDTCYDADDRGRDSGKLAAVHADVVHLDRYLVESNRGGTPRLVGRGREKKASRRRRHGTQESRPRAAERDRSVGPDERRRSPWLGRKHKRQRARPVRAHENERRGRRLRVDGQVFGPRQEADESPIGSSLLHRAQSRDRWVRCRERVEPVDPLGGKEGDPAVA